MSTADDAKTRTRSPAYPSVSLEKAIERAKELYSHEKRNPVHVDVVLGHWSYEAGSSNGMRAVAALLQFGLLVDQGKKEDRQVKLSPLAIDILMPEEDGSIEHRKAIQTAALLPPLHKAIWGKYSGELPSDPALKRYLLLERNFNDAAVSAFINQFRATISFAKLGAGDKIEGEVGDTDDATPDNPPTARQAMQTATLPLPQKVAAVAFGAPSHTMRLPVTLPTLKVAYIEVPYPLNDLEFKTLCNSLTSFKDALVVTPQGQQVGPPADAE